MTDHKHFTTIQDAIDYEVEPALGEHAKDYDMKSIAREYFETVLENAPDFYPATMHATRCTDFIATPPPPGWAWSCSAGRWLTTSLRASGTC